MLGPLVAQHLELLLGGRIAERRAQEEAVELRLRQRERPLVLDRVLCREQEKRARDRTRDAVDGYLALGHRLEERRLRLGHRPVDLVHEHDVREDRAGTELEVPDALVVDREPGDIRRLQVGGALNSRPDSALDRLRHGASEHGLGRARDVLEQHMPVARERGQDEPDLVTLAVNDRLDVPEQSIGDLDRVAELISLNSPGGHADECSWANQRSRSPEERASRRGRARFREGYGARRPGAPRDAFLGAPGHRAACPVRRAPEAVAPGRRGAAWQ